MMRTSIVYAVLFVAAFGSARALSGGPAPAPSSRAAPTPTPGNLAGGANRPTSPPVSGHPVAALPLLPAAGKTIDVSHLGEIDRAILEAPSVAKAHEVAMARVVLRRALSGWVLEQVRRCPSLASSVPSQLDLMVRVRVEGANGIEVHAIDSLTIGQGAPLPAEGLTCLEAALTSSLPKRIDRKGLTGLVFNGSFRSSVQVNTGSCTL